MTDAHRLEQEPVGDAVVGACTCGWRQQAGRAEQLQQLWRLHVEVARATDSFCRADATYRLASNRCDELVAQWARARVHHSETRRRHQALMSEVERRRVMAIPRAAQVDDIRCRRLDAARVMAHLTVTELWLDYMSLGGGASLEELQQTLACQRPPSRSDYNRLVVALNERFSSAGMGNPLEYEPPGYDD